MKNISRIVREAKSSPDGPYCPDAGDVVALDFSPQAGREQAGARPALVLSSRLYNERARLCMVCPITSTVRGGPFEVAVPAGIALPKGVGVIDGASEGELRGVILSDQAKSQSWQHRGCVMIGVVPASSLAEVRARAAAVMGYTE
ncbi:mRNA interferase MazF [Methylobacterium sp. 174MFSha1.1]|uniref:type II toxin-antitoxin system PemK/MazF family toxin n=1 Tax=Methylobacterium sp. 174MFSha1.1 TaxID=1502749 RepID=UPI0008ED333A|nr:type II toxin-antitoxin system PemK/MazF family toxin [Methylobacterium sp. 174MFSha1.1]SFV03817.1 mRNA interferase MazF [Methylobacterium sp. 174MFSha1.1]